MIRKWYSYQKSLKDRSGEFSQKEAKGLRTNDFSKLKLNFSYNFTIYMSTTETLKGL